MVLWIPSDRNDRRIFLGLKFSILGFFWVGKFWPAFFWGYLDLSRDFFGCLNIQYNLKIRDSSQVSWPRSSVNKVKPNLFCDCFNI